MICPICQHDYDEMTEHHWTPKSRGGKTKTALCSHCHKQIHAIFTEKELELNFNTFELVLRDSRIKKWIKWIRKRKPTSKIKVRQSKTRRR